MHKVLMIMVMLNKHQVPVPQTQTRIQKNSTTLHMLMTILKKIYQIFQLLNWILMLDFNWTNYLNRVAGTPFM